MRVKCGKKGFFVHPVIYYFAKKLFSLRENKLNFHYVNRDLNFNVRSSFYINRLRDVIVYAHNGREVLPSHPHDFLKNKYTFKIGQITYNRHILEKRAARGFKEYIIGDMNKKKGAVLKVARRKKYTYFKYGSSS